MTAVSVCEADVAHVRFGFLVGGVAITLKPWVQTPEDPREQGVRIEIQKLTVGSRPHPLATPASELGAPLFRGDLFARIDGEPGNWSAAHFHTRFNAEWSPIGRQWDEKLTADPKAWFLARLAALSELLSESAGADLVAPVDQAGLTRVLPLVAAAFDSCLEHLTSN